MLKTKLLHPEILCALGSMGHGSRILIADGNFPFKTHTPAAAAKVFLNLMPGVVPVTQVLEALVETVPIESASVMVPPDGAYQPVFDEYANHLPGVEMKRYKRLEFYQEANAGQTGLVIATGEQRRFANLLLTIGVIRSPLHES
jgi:L-fucose mutarotase